MQQLPWYTIGLDLGQSKDYTALAIVETRAFLSGKILRELRFAPSGSRQRGIAEVVQVGDLRGGCWYAPERLDPRLLDHILKHDYETWPHKPELAVRHLERYPLGTSYVDIVKGVQALLSQPPFTSHTTALVIDRTGVGRGVFDLFVEAGLEPIGVSIHAGANVNGIVPELGVPKRDLVSATQAVLQTKRLKIASSLPHAKTLTEELQNFKVTIDPKTAHDSYSAWREGGHDDLVLALALAVWFRDYYWQHYDNTLVTPAAALAS